MVSLVILVHRDIKPANILLAKLPPSNDVKAVICDFGLSSELGFGQSSKTTEFGGTYSWIAPEMFKDGKKVIKSITLLIVHDIILLEM